ncbi:MAG TPA: hypothetical protein VIM58_07845 [Candidatus Methylacidiphilales bacterium]
MSKAIPAKAKKVTIKAIRVKTAKAPGKSIAKTGAVLVRERFATLSATLDETSRRFLSRLRREIEEAEEALLAASPKKQDKAVRLVDDLQVKPAKGRRKDLKKIDLLIGELQKLAEEK